MTHKINARSYDRFRLEPMYTSVTVRRVHDMKMERFDGHAYDVSEVGARVEIDAALEANEDIAISLGLPGVEREIVASGRVIWVADDSDDPAARRTAVQFVRFATPEDRARLLRYLGTAGLRRSA